MFQKKILYISLLTHEEKLDRIKHYHFTKQRAMKSPWVIDSHQQLLICFFCCLTPAYYFYVAKLALLYVYKYDVCCLSVCLQLKCLSFLWFQIIHLNSYYYHLKQLWTFSTNELTLFIKLRFFCAVSSTLCWAQSSVGKIQFNFWFCISVILLFFMFA